MDAPGTAALLSLDGLADQGWASLPSAAGVVQLLDRAGRPLVTARAANLRRWVVAKLAAPKPAAPGRRPPLDLRPLATAARLARTTSPFHQRLVFERLMAGEVPLHKRKDLKPPVYLRLDLAPRFPRVELQGAGEGELFGPLRDRRAAEAASKALHKLFPLRPCDFEFEPDPALPLGLGCFYAQVRTCAAPCLGRVSPADYRALALRAAAFLADPSARPDEARAWLPEFAGRAGGAALVIESVRRAVEVWPVRGGAVLDGQALRSAAAPDDATLASWSRALAAAFSADDAAGAGDDRPWLAAHLFARPRSTTYLPLVGGVDAPALLDALHDRLSVPPG